MASQIPEGLWLPILIMAGILLALLWNDRISKSSSKKSKSSSTSNDGPSVSLRKRGSSKVGEEFTLRGSYNSGDGSISEYKLAMNGRDITGKISSWSGGSFETNTIEIPDVDKVECEIEVSATYGQSSDSIDFKPSKENELNPPTLNINVDKEDADPGKDNGSFEIEAEPVPGDNDIEKTLLELPDLDIEKESTGNNSVIVSKDKVPPGEYRYRAETTDGVTEPVGKADTFKIRGHHEGDLEVNAGHEIINRNDGKVRLWAKVDFSRKELDYTRLGFRKYKDGGMIDIDEFGGQNLKGKQNDNSDSVELEEDFSPEKWAYIGVAKDVSGNVDVDRGTFEVGSGTGSAGGDGPQQVPGDFPDSWAPIFQNTNNNFNGVPPQFWEIIVEIGQLIADRDNTGDVTQEVGMDAYQLLLALNALEPDLSGEDNSEILEELREIKNNLNQNEISSDQLEDALRSVLHDVFGQDLQSVVQGLDLGGGFDEQAIVQAIENKNVDLSEVADRLENIEQTVDRIQDQGGNVDDLEQKLNNIESAVRDLKVDDQIYRELTSEIRSLRDQGVEVNLDMNDPLIIKLAEDIKSSESPRDEHERIIQTIKQEQIITRRVLIQIMGETGQQEESRGQGNKNQENNNEAMANDIKGLEHELDTDIKRQIEHLEGEYKNLRNLVQDQGEIETLESNMEHEIEEVTEHLKKARQIEHHLDTLFDEKKNMSDSKFAAKLNDDIHDLNGHISKAENVISKFKDDFGVFRADVNDLENVVSSMDKVEGQIEQQEEELDKVKDHMEKAIQQLQDNPDVSIEEYTN